MMHRDDIFLSDRKCAPHKLGRVLVLGLGVSGKACTSYLLDLLGSRLDELYVAGESPDEVQGSSYAWVEDARAHGANIVFGDELADTTYDLCIASPGISRYSDFYEKAQRSSNEIVSEVEFAWRESPKTSRWIAVTGTNGKTTTTALCAYILRTSNLRARAVGNIGDACISAVAEGTTDIFVAETSSFQLASTALFAPDVAVVLNITPDHLSWHKTHKDYAESKWKILANLHTLPHACAVLNATNDEVRAKIREIRAQNDRGYDYIPLGAADGLDSDMRRVCGSDNAAFVDDQGMLRVAFDGKEIPLGAKSDLKIKGEHNVANALAASCAALVLGADAEAARSALSSFEALEHRCEYAGEVNGVGCYNDSKATNVDAALAALSAFDKGRVVLLLGGHDKGCDLAELVRACVQYARAVICFGEAKQRFLQAFDEAHVQASIDVLSADHLADAFDVALNVAHKGDVILLSPACSSFDEFSCFEERGRVFKRLVKEHATHAPVVDCDTAGEVVPR